MRTCLTSVDDGLESEPGLQPASPILNHEQKKQAVVFALFADAPATKEIVRYFFNGLAIESFGA